MPARRSFLLLALLLLCCGCGSKPATLFDSEYDQREMNAAINRARYEVDRFLAEMHAGHGTDWSVKVPIQDGDQVEHFWLTDIAYRNGQFTGLIGNDPGIVSNVSFGDEWTVGKYEISDWMFLRDGRIHGNYTMRPMLGSLPAQEADQLRAMLAER